MTTLPLATRLFEFAKARDFKFEFFNVGRVFKWIFVTVLDDKIEGASKWQF